MTKRIADVMTKNPKTLAADATANEAARIMREQDIGAVLVTEQGGGLCGLITDRDIVTRVLATGRSPDVTTLGDVCSRKPAHIGSAQGVGEAVKLMADNAIRRLPVVDDGTPVGIVTLGDLARSQDPKSALGAISASPPTR